MTTATVVVIKEDPTNATRKTIFLLTVMHLDPSGDRHFTRHRTWGWFPTFEQAETCVMENHTDIYEDGYYNTVVLEEMAWGPLALAKTEHWYSVTALLDKDRRVSGYDVKKIEKPEALAGSVCFGMG